MGGMLPVPPEHAGLDVISTKKHSWGAGFSDKTLGIAVGLGVTLSSSPIAGSLLGKPPRALVGTGVRSGDEQLVGNAGPDGVISLEHPIGRRVPRCPTCCWGRSSAMLQEPEPWAGNWSASELPHLPMRTCLLQCQGQSKSSHEAGGASSQGRLFSAFTTGNALCSESQNSVSI